VPIQKKFICGLGRGVYGMFRQKLLTKVWIKNVINFVKLNANFKSKRLRNPLKNGWNRSNTNAIISFNGLQVSDYREHFSIVFAKKGFPISGELSRKEDNFPGTILYYFEVIQISEMISDDLNW
jgi:hypothetical protein